MVCPKIVGEWIVIFLDSFVLKKVRISYRQRHPNTGQENPPGYLLALVLADQKKKKKKQVAVR